METELKDRLHAVEQSSTDTKTRLGVVEDQLNKLGNKVDRVLDIMSASIHRKEFKPAEVLSFVKDIGILAGMACASIIYFASQPGQVDITAREEMAVMKYKMSVMEKQIGWKATIQ